VAVGKGLVGKGEFAETGNGDGEEVGFWPEVATLKPFFCKNMKE